MRHWVGLAATGLFCAAIGFAAGRVSLPPSPKAPVQTAVTAPAAPPPPPSSIAVAAAPATPPAPPAPAQQASGVRALNLMATAPDTSRGNARACLTFSAPLATGDGIHPGDFVRIVPAVATAVQTDGAKLCVGGLAFGTNPQKRTSPTTASFCRET
jgi:hypothetical protein